MARAAIETVLPEAAAGAASPSTLRRPRPVPLTADRGEMEIILNNLLTNAVKYNRDGGRVDVRLGAPAAGRAASRCADTGIGMTAEECGRLFHEFVRIKNDKTRNILGSGLGLSIVRKLARALRRRRARWRARRTSARTFTVELARSRRWPRRRGGAAPVPPTGALAATA